MSKSVAADSEIQNLLVRRKLVEGVDSLNLDFLQLVPISNESKSMIEFQESTNKHAYVQLKALFDDQVRRLRVDDGWHGEDRQNIFSSLDSAGRRARWNELNRTIYVDVYRHHQHPLYGRALLEKLSIKTTYDSLSHLSGKPSLPRFWDRSAPISNLTMIQSVQTRSEQMYPLIDKYAFITPAVVANDLPALSLTEATSNFVRTDPISLTTVADPFHLPRMKLSIAFPDKRLLQYDCGKLQRLAVLLARLKREGHRALIFTQMTKVLDILESFLNLHGHLYLRLDGSTRIEQRQLLTERFNNDPRILCFILSSRSGGLGINLTGADTVIFYDLDWNPAMDRQCTDRAHRIGQTRDVHIYRFVSEHTIESNILRKARQKELLDSVVIQEGEFTTDYLNKMTYKDMLNDDEEDAAGAAMDRVLGQAGNGGFEQAEDKEDIAAAKVAQREVQHADDGDFDEKAGATNPATGTTIPAGAGQLGPMAATNAAIAAEGAEVAAKEDGVDEYMVKLYMWLLKDVPLAPKETKKKRREEHGRRRR
jgi:helicase SWR1